MSRIIVLDDFFPDLSTGFRIAEFGWLLRRNIVDDVYTTASPFDELLSDFAGIEPSLASRVHAYEPMALRDADLASMVFLNNAVHYISDLEEHSVPFVVTLYPGGGLDLGDEVTHAKLTRVIGSPMLRHVITTQPRTTDYLREHFGHDIPLTEIPGVVVDTSYFVPGAGLRDNYYPRSSRLLSLGFIAHRYSERGDDKGFPAFIELVRILVARGHPVRAHVIGGFEDSDLKPSTRSELNGRLRFHGTLTGQALRTAMSTLDIVVSPNRPGVLTPAAFDGFPTGSAIEAALCGVAMVVTDELDQNRLFRPGFDIEIVTLEPSDIADAIERLVLVEDGIASLAQAGLRQSRTSYGIEAQLDSRRRILERAAGRVS
jgi:lipopolysaccharide transport system ATP-binding protein